jgi:hypothetical protein
MYLCVRGYQFCLFLDFSIFWNSVVFFFSFSFYLNPYQCVFIRICQWFIFCIFTHIQKAVLQNKQAQECRYLPIFLLKLWQKCCRYKRGNQDSKNASTKMLIKQKHWEHEIKFLFGNEKKDMVLYYYESSDQVS